MSKIREGFWVSPHKFPPMARIKGRGRGQRVAAVGENSSADDGCCRGERGEGSGQRRGKVRGE